MALFGGERPWFWGVQSFQRQGRALRLPRHALPAAGAVMAASLFGGAVNLVRPYRNGMRN